ncbi:uncharacterized protein LOC141714213 [Apium graveolens]|uniref:uncharacterized protein LOC141714213 n=1 Tax=Apium graveolens TaxID=4045 RepID=UPI003D7AC5A8
MSNSSSVNRVICDCGLNALIRTLWTNKNPGRRFWSCQKNKDERSCNFFMWIDDEMSGRARNLLCELTQRNVMLEQNLLKLEEKLYKMKKKKKMIKKQKQTQNLLLCTVVVCMFAIIVVLVVSRELNTGQRKYPP